MKKTLFPILVISFLFASSCEQMEPPLTPVSIDNSPVVLNAKSDNQINDRYIVVYKNSVQDPETKTKNIRNKRGIKSGFVYKHAIKGFSARLKKAELEALKADSDIAFIEPDYKQHAYAQYVPTGISRIMANTVYSDNSNVDVAIIDSGIDIDHPDLNVAGGVRFYSQEEGEDIVSYSDTNYDDELGHGTHVAGIVGALNNKIGVIGVAPGCNLWAVRVLDSNGDGYISDIIKGLDWVAERASQIEIINISIGGTGYSVAYRNAVKNCVSKGVIIFAAAGNSGRDIYGYDNTFGTFDDEMPASFPEVAAISALADSDGLIGGTGPATTWGPDDSFPMISNHSKSVVSNNPVVSSGKAIDLILPGIDIYSTFNKKKYTVMSGTSMAAPHAAGLAAVYIAQHGRANDSLGVYSIRQALIDNGLQQTSIFGLKTLNDPDGNLEKLGWISPGITVPPDPGNQKSLEIISISPDTIGTGNTMLIFKGTGFDQGSEVEFINGNAEYAPVIKSYSFINTKTLKIKVHVSKKFPFKRKTWDVLITNPDGKTFKLKKGITVFPLISTEN